MTYFYGLAFKSFPVAINYFELLTVIVGSYFLGLNASDETLDSFSVSTCIIEQWLLLSMQGNGWNAIALGVHTQLFSFAGEDLRLVKQLN